MRRSTDETSTKDCPICDKEVCLSTIQRHVNAHLDFEVEAGDRELAAKLELRVPDDDLFVESQQSGDALRRVARLDDSDDSVTCTLGCEQLVPLYEWDSHVVMHQLEAEEIAAEMDREEQDKRSELAARVAQQGFFAPLQLQHGVLKGESSQGGREARRHVSPHAGITVRGGAETGGGAEAQDPPVAEQRETIRRRAPEGIVELLQQALEADCKGICRAALSGYVDHYESRRRDDLGWGCGWRNIQMLCSNLVEDPEISGAIFGGGGTVPEITELQKWLEQAWKDGFDVMGAEQLGWNVRETQKWIGTTECAALLRSFGLRARIADFRASNVRSKREQRGGDSQDGNRGQSAKRARTDSAVAPAEMSGGNQDGEHRDHAVHSGVQCDHCGMNPIRGARYKSTVKDNFDLCEQCKEVADDQEASRGVTRLHLYLKMDTPHVLEDRTENTQKGGGAGSGARTESANAHMRLIEWVWKYFTTGAGAAEGSEADEAPTSQRRHVIMSNRPPLYFQHEGHSRTIAGIERRRSRPDAPEEAFLLILDPSQRTAEVVEALRQKKGWQRLIKRGVHTLRKPEYQLCFVEPGIATGEELEKLKVLDSVLHQY